MSKDIIPDRGLIIALSLLLLVRFIFAAQIALVEDETYYRLWGLFPSYAYFDHAPMVGWWITIGQFIFGDTAFGLRFLSPLSALIGSLFIWRIAQLSFDRSVANHAVVLFNAMPMIGVGSILMTPDIPSVFFWGLAIWTLVEWNRSNRNVWWIWFGLAAGLGMLSKYTNIFLGVGVLLWLVISGRWRQAIRTPEFYCAGLLALVLFSPVIYWNAVHEWASFSKQLGRLQSHDFTFRFFGEWSAGQILLISPVIFGFLVATLILGRNSKLRRNINAQLIVMSFLPMIVYFFIHVFSSRINANWTVSLYSNFSILAAVSHRDLWTSQHSRSRQLIYLAAPLGFVMTAFVLIEALCAVLPASAKNPLSQLRGYNEMANDVRKVAKLYDAETLLTSSYQITGELSFHIKDLAVIQLNERIRYLNMPKPEDILFAKPVLFIARETEAGQVLKGFEPCIANAERLQTIQRKDRGLVLDTYEVWRIRSVDPKIFARGHVEDCDAARQI